MPFAWANPPPSDGSDTDPVSERYPGLREAGLCQRSESDAHCYRRNTSSAHPYEDYGHRLRAAELVSPLASNVFGDSTSLYNGATEFSVVDIDLPGNNDLPVRLARRFKVESRKNGTPLPGFGAWEIDVPYISGTFDSMAHRGSVWVQSGVLR